MSVRAVDVAIHRLRALMDEMVDVDPEDWLPEHTLHVMDGSAGFMVRLLIPTRRRPAPAGASSPWSHPPLGAPLPSSASYRTSELNGAISESS